MSNPTLTLTLNCDKATSVLQEIELTLQPFEILQFWEFCAVFPHDNLIIIIMCVVLQYELFPHHSLKSEEAGHVQGISISMSRVCMAHARTT